MIPACSGRDAADSNGVGAARDLRKLIPRLRGKQARDLRKLIPRLRGKLSLRLAS